MATSQIHSTADFELSVETVKVKVKVRVIEKMSVAVVALDLWQLLATLVATGYADLLSRGHRILLFTPPLLNIHPLASTA